MRIIISTLIASIFKNNTDTKKRERTILLIAVKRKPYSATKWRRRTELKHSHQPSHLHTNTLQVTKKTQHSII